MQIEVDREELNIVLNMAKYWLEGRYPVEFVTDATWEEGRDALNNVITIVVKEQGV